MKKRTNDPLSKIGSRRAPTEMLHEITRLEVQYRLRPILYLDTIRGKERKKKKVDSQHVSVTSPINLSYCNV